MGEMNFKKVCYLTQYVETLPFQYVINIDSISFNFSIIKIKQPLKISFKSH